MGVGEGERWRMRGEGGRKGGREGEEKGDRWVGKKEA